MRSFAGIARVVIWFVDMKCKYHINVVLRFLEVEGAGADMESY
jgi:hypothetical protein